MVDEGVELEIRAALLGAFPSWGYLGEELGGVAGRDPEGHVWVVDPQDGTAAGLRGWRGGSVAIGLVRAGVPVLGVVLVYAPTGGVPELIAWAEGCGPIARNGVAFEREAFAGALRGEHAVAVSQAADRSEASSRANAELCQPARFWPLASLAQRLARVALGEVEAAVALHGPSAWDFAAGHALVRAVGGELVDEAGALVRYDSEGRARVGRCFAGGLAVVRELAGRDWARVHGGGDEAVEPVLGLRQPLPGVVVADAGPLGRARGCWFGQLGGDALGSLVEFQRADAIAGRYPQGVRRLADGGAFDTLAGQPTDDSELALMLARALLVEGGFDDEATARAYASWYDSRPFDMGGTTAAALRPASEALHGGASVARAARAGAAQSMASQANGALMRVSPLGIFGWRLPELELAALARRDAALTHPNPICLDANALYVVTIAHAIAKGPSPQGLYEFATGFATRAGLHADVVECVREAGEGPPPEFQAQMGWLRIALRNAFFQLVHASDFEAGVVDTVMRGGDTDTNAAIAGALLGAVHGCDAIPRQWRERVVTCRPIAGLAGVRQARPRAFWPVDAELVAEQLLALGDA